MKHAIFVAASLGWLCAGPLTPSGLSQAPDRRDNQPEAALREQPLRLNGGADIPAVKEDVPVTNLDEAIFRTRSASAGRKNIETKLKLQLEEIDLACGLEAEEKGRLLLAARGDLQRFFEQVEMLRKKYSTANGEFAIGRERTAAAWQDMQLLRTQVVSGLFREGSLFRKTLRNTLSSKQMEICEKLEEPHRLFRFRACLAKIVATLEMGSPFREEQRGALLKLLEVHIQPPQRIGQYDEYVILRELDALPRDKLKAIFNESELRAFGRQMEVMQRVERHLVEAGKLVPEHDKLGAGKNEALPPVDMAAELNRDAALVNAELHFLHSVCGLTKEQRKSVTAALDGWFGPSDQGHTGVRPQKQQTIPIASLHQCKLIQAVIEKNSTDVLLPEQLARYRTELSARRAHRRRVVMLGLVSKFDDALVLTAQQRENLYASLAANWSEEWERSMQDWQHESEVIPTMNFQHVVPFLNRNQTSLWWQALTRLPEGTIARVDLPAAGMQDPPWEREQDN